MGATPLTDEFPNSKGVGRGMADLIVIPWTLRTDG